MTKAHGTRVRALDHEHNTRKTAIYVVSYIYIPLGRCVAALSNDTRFIRMYIHKTRELCVVLPLYFQTDAAVASPSDLLLLSTLSTTFIVFFIRVSSLSPCVGDTRSKVFHLIRPVTLYKWDLVANANSYVLNLEPLHNFVIVVPE